MPGAAGILISMLLASAVAQPGDRLDAVFAPMAAANGPGCAVGVAHAGAAVLARAYGAADLEHDVPNTASTVFEAGSVSKQFTAAAILMLVADGRLRLTDDVRAYLPELPDYGAVVTVDHLLSHTSGLRDWGSVMSLAGWPRGTRAYTMDDVLTIIARQRKLNYAPGAEYSYTNSGYNLLAIIVQRVSGTSLAEFTRARIFAPLGMRSTGWRDDFRRVVPGRAIAYSPAKAGFAQDMPFEDAYGNGGLLTTVQDLLTWNDALTSGRLGGRIAEQLAERAILNDGRRIPYARGVVVQPYRGQSEIAHSGSTGGYRAWLGRYPERRLSIALLCNVEVENVVALGHEVADRFLPPSPAAPAQAAAAAPVETEGAFVNERTGMPVRLRPEGGKLRMVGGRLFDSAGPNLFRSAGSELRLVDARQFRIVTAEGETSYRRTDPYAPDAAALAPLAGRYASDEAGVEYRVRSEGGKLVLASAERPRAVIELVPAYRDAFTAGGVLFRFRRNSDGKVVALSAANERVRDLEFTRIDSAGAAR